MTAKERAAQLGVSRATYFRHKGKMEHDAQLQQRALEKQAAESAKARKTKKVDLGDMTLKELQEMEFMSRLGLYPIGRNERGIMYS